MVPNTKLRCYHEIHRTLDTAVLTQIFNVCLLELVTVPYVYFTEKENEDHKEQ